MNTDLAKKVIDAGRVLWASGQGDFTSGHISARLPEQPDHFLMKCAATGLEEITLDNLLTLDLEDRVVEGTSKPHREVPIHSEILKARPDINCVVHTHPVHVIAFYALGIDINCVSNDGVYFKDRVSIFTESSDLIVDKPGGAAVARCLADNPVVVLRNHGLVTAGRTIEEAVWLALRLERACQIQLMTEYAGGAKHVATDEDIAAKNDRANNFEVYAKIFNYLVRTTRSEDPGKRS